MKSTRESMGVFAFAVMAVALLALSILRGFPAHQDEIFFKAAGLHWADGQGWNAPEEHNFGNWEPPLQEVFASYPPLYPFFYGVVVKYAGFSQRTANTYDASIHVLLALALVMFAKQVMGQGLAMPWVIGGLWLLCGYAPRPDRLAMLFGYMAIALVFWRSSRYGKTRDVLAGLALGGCFATSFPCTLALAPLLMGGCFLSSENWNKAVWRIFKIGLIAISTGAACIIPVLLYHSGAIQQNMAATSSITNTIGFVEGLKHLTRFHIPAVLATSVLLGMGGAFLFHARERVNPTAWKLWLVWYAIPAVPLTIFLMKSTFQGGYHWFLIPWLSVALFVPAIHGKLSETMRGWILVAALFVAIAHSQKTNLSSMASGGQQQVLRFQSEVEKLVPAGATVAARDYWWLLARRNQVFDTMVGYRLEQPVDYIVVTGFGSGALGRPQSMPTRIYEDYEVVLNELGRLRPSIFGLPLSRSTYSAGPLILKRKSLSADQKSAE
jgi:hypothetical protein